jgi:tRNA 2-selenouridine synthase
MNSAVIPEDQFEKLFLAGLPIIDVRAPVEFQEGSAPGSVNFPILNNEERAQVGTLYKQKGQEAAIALGNKLVAGEVKEQRLQAWKNFIQARPDTVITCFRGGLRSRTAQTWLLENGVDCPRIDGGYKHLRQFCLSTIEKFSSTQELRVISGATGSGKSLLLRSLKGHRKIIDLEKSAHHRGSAFGAYAEAQPSQIDFENRTAVEMLSCLSSADHRATLIEDESRLVGRCVQPGVLFDRLRSSSAILVEEDLQSRVQVTFEDYILNSSLNSDSDTGAQQVFARYRQALLKISNKLGGLRTQEILTDLDNAWSDQSAGRGLDSHRVWIQKLLEYYYDPMYMGSIDSRKPAIVFRGSRSACLEYLKSES